MNIGIVELPSGKWEWSAFRSAGGTTIVYRHWTRYEEEMRTWIPVQDLASGKALEAAKEAILRIWVDGFGARWEISLELIRTSRAPASAEAAGQIWMVFARGTQKLRVAVPEEVRLGELTPFELTRLLAAGEAEPSERLRRATRREDGTLSAA